MKVLITGVAGQLGHDVAIELNKRNIKYTGTDIIVPNNNMVLRLGDLIDDESKITPSYFQCDLTKESDVKSLFSSNHPDVVIHCAAWTAVDAAEDIENKKKVHAVNVIGTQNIANACKEYRCKMMYISTDYVFNGDGTDPWQSDCKDYVPLNYYGQTKLDGELAVANTLDKYFIVRIAWVFGKNGNNFVKTMLKLSETHDTLRVVNDQIGTPTYTPDLARLLVDMIQTEKYGYYHATNDEDGEYISWHDFACEIFRQAGKDVNVIPVTTEEYGLSKAKRPFNSRLDKTKLEKQGFKKLPNWKDALHRYLIETGVIDK